jgi:exonuclease SbcC
MRITQVDLENVKSYRRQSVVFTEGTNAICGPNGAGKSTLLEAIGFALFDFLPCSQSQFIREGEKAATVTVHVVSDDGRTYQVARRCGSRGHYYVYDPEIGQKLTNGATETLLWLHEFMEVEETDSLSALFQDAVGVPQGLLTAAFLDKAGNRKNTFNPLLRVDEYDRAWDALRGSRSWLEKGIAEQKMRIASFETEVRALPGLREKVTSLQAEIEVDEKRRDDSQSQLEEVTRRKETLEAVKQQLDALERTVARAYADLRMLGARLAEAQTAVKRAEQARSVVRKAEPGYQAYLAAQANLAELEKLRKEYERLSKTLRGYATDLALAQQQVHGLESRLEDIVSAEAEMGTLRPQVEAQERMEDELDEARRTADRLTDAQRNLGKEKSRLADLEIRLSKLHADLAQLAQVEREIAALRTEVEGLDHQREAWTARVTMHKVELDQLREQTAALETIEAAECPVCEAPLTPERRAELLARNQARQTELETTLAALQSQRETTETTRCEKQKTLHKLEKQAGQLPRPAEVDDLTAQIEAQRKAVTESEAAVAGLAVAPARVKRLEAELKALGNPRRDYQRAADTADEREAVEQELAATWERIAGLSSHIDTLEEQLATYADLDERFGAERAAQAAYEADHRRYLEHVREAGTLEKCRQSAAALSDQRKATQTRYDQLVQERDQVASGYDADTYTKLAKTHAALSRELATLDERLRLKRNQVAEDQAEIARLEDVQGQLDVARTGHTELVDILALLEHLRQVLHEAGPKVTQALVEIISIQAGHLYANIMADHTARLRWKEDYEIVLTTGGRERCFQQLSGGEQMAAALAVRLALLREVSAIDVAFFDEPTANLDDHRRDNLAEQILNVKGFSQLFVVSHDDTFEQNTDNVVRVAKEDGVSRVEA